MGVPTFFKWLSLRYPKSIEYENNQDVDNFYIDMNGLIHASIGDFQRLSETIESLVKLANPKKLLYLAIDGVAPRAKMNQQRTRRFSNKRLKAFNSNCITPGTEFMGDLALRMREFISAKMREDWKHLAIVFSDSNDPGEGEHKILEFIRSQRGRPDYDFNTVHMLFGIDADLIMLALATHELHFYILRPVFKDPNSEVSQPDYLFLKIPVLREYLFFEFQSLVRFNCFDFERVIDDFVLLCFLVGNDFLPGLPSFSIRDGAIDGLIYLYTKIFYKFGGYLTNQGKINPENLNYVFCELAKVETRFFIEKKQRNEFFRQREMAEKGQVDPEFEEDKLRLGEDQYKSRYYFEKFKITEVNEFIPIIKHSYIEGLQWVFYYYYDGCPSWSWFYPFQFAPFATDLVEISDLILEFPIGQPFDPFAQLLAVLPPHSAYLLPDCLSSLLSDPESPIIDFYPSSHKVDRHQWYEIALLPFIDETRLYTAYKSRLSEISADISVRNSRSYLLLYYIENPAFLKMTIHEQIENSEVTVHKVSNLPKVTHSSEIGYNSIFPSSEVNREDFLEGDRKRYGFYFFTNMISAMLPIDRRYWDREENYLRSHEGEKRFKIN